MRHGNVVGVRSDEIRTLVRRAAAQGFEVGRSGSGHVRLTAPDGTVAYVSGTINSGDFRSIRNARNALVRAGLRADWSKRDARRAVRANAEVKPDAEDSPMTDLQQQEQHKPPPPGKGEQHARFSTGRTMFVSDDTVRMSGIDVRIRRQANGALIAWTPPDKTPPLMEKSWSVGPRDLRKQPRTAAAQRVILADKVAEWVRAGKPKKLQQHRKTKSDEVASMAPTNGIAAESGPRPAPAPAARSAPPELDVVDEPGVAWLTVRLDRSEYPLARSLSELVEKIAPAIQALEASGRKAAADLLVESVELTPAERELVNLWQEVNNRPRLEHGRSAPDD